MKIECKFGIGDKVYLIARLSKSEIMPCTFCDGTRSLTGKDKTKCKCPVCEGTGELTKYSDLEYSVLDSVTISYITLRVGARGQDEVYLMEEGEICRKHSFGPAELFATKEEAQAQCDRWNGKKI